MELFGGKPGFDGWARERAPVGDDAADFVEWRNITINQIGTSHKLWHVIEWPRRDLSLIKRIGEEFFAGAKGEKWHIVR